MPVPDRPTAAIVKKVRKHTGLTQKALGELLGVSTRAVVDWEAGVRNMAKPTWELLLIRTGLGKTPAFFDEE